MSARGIAATVAALALAVTTTACGDKAEPAPEITIARAAAPASLDPALAADRDTLEAIWLTHTPLLTYRHAEGESGTELIPGLASDLPEISDDSRTYRLTLRKDLTYSDGTQAVASDFERAVARDIRLGSPAAPYLREIDSIRTNDTSGEITIRLTRPNAAFASVLAMPATAPVPAGQEPPPGIGPYELSADGAGDLTLVRSEGFQDFDIPDIPRGNVAEIAIQVVPDARERTRLVLDGELDSMQGPPGAGLGPQLGDRFVQSPSASTTYALLDRTREPFDDPTVREAVALAVDSAGCSLIPPGLIGYNEEFDRTGCEQDMEAARTLISDAGAEGATATVAGAGTPRTRQFIRELRAAGLDARPQRAGGEASAEIVNRHASIAEPFDFFERVADEPVVAAELAELRRDPDGVAGWLALERYVTTPPRTYLVSLAHERETTLFSERMDPGSAVVHPLFGNDLSSWRLEEGK